MMQFKSEFSGVSQLIQGKNNILLASHERPDGDAVGSMIAMFSVLRRMTDKKVLMFSKDPVPEQFKFLPYWENISLRTSDIEELCPDLFLAFDYGDFNRLGVDGDLIKDAVIVTFDHHPDINQRGDIKIIDPDCSSTCEIVYQFLSQEEYEISPQTASALLTGIFTDTGGLAHVNTSTETLRVVGNLLRYGTSIKNLHKHTFSGKTPDNLRTWGKVLKNIIQDEEVSMAYVAITFAQFEEFGASLEGFEGIVNVICMPPNVRFSLMLVEHNPGVVKGSLRSEPFKGVDVSKIARVMGGGGHKYAAGFEREGETLQDVVQYVKRVAHKQLTTDH